MDEDRLTPQLGRLIDASKAAAEAPAVGTAVAAPEGGWAAVTGKGGATAPRSEAWAALGLDGKVYPGPRLAGVLAAARGAGTEPEAVAFAVAGESGETLLPQEGWRRGADGVDPHLPVAVKYLGRWVVVTLEEIPG